MTPYSSFYSGYGSCLPALSPTWAGQGQGYCSSSAGDPAKIPYSELLRPSPPMSFFPKRTDTCGPKAPSNCGGYMKLPPISGQICGNHPRDDCCRVPRLPSISSEDYCCPKPSNCCQPAVNYVELTPRVKKEQSYSPPNVPFDGCSLYRTQFQGCYAPPARSFKPGTTFCATDGRMDGCSTYRESFPWKIGETVRIRKDKEQYCPPAIPFGGGSTYRQDFQGFCVSRTPSFKPDNTTDSSGGRMDGMSSYRADFIPYCPAEYNYARGISMKPEGSGSGMPCSPFQGCSTYRMDFIPNFFCKPRLHNPDNSGCA